MQRRTLWLIIGILGICVLVTLVSIGGLLAVLSILAALLNDEPPNTSSILQAIGLIALGLGAGISLALTSWAGWREQLSRSFKPSRNRWRWLALVPAFVTLVALGAAIGWLPKAINLPVQVSIETWIQTLLLSPIHILATSIPSLLMLGLAGWGLRGTGGTQRDVVTGMTSGGCLGIGISMVTELLIVVVVVIIVIVAVIFSPGGMDQFQELALNLEDPAWQADISNVIDLLLSPAVILPLFGIVCILVPLLEEVFKTLAGAIAGYWIRPHPGRAFFWGVAAGAGFALTENLLNGAAGSTENWAPFVVARVGTTAMHCLASGMIGWGWGQLWTARRPLRLLATYAAAVFLHGLWNLLSVGMSYMSILAQAQDKAMWNSAPGLATITIIAILCFLTVSFFIALFLIARRLATQREDHLQDSFVIPEATPCPPPRVPTL